jgi:hypothetical protein
MNIPLFARKFITDFAETALAAIFALTLAIPTTPGDLKNIGYAIGVGVLGAAISAARRAIPGFLLWLGEQVGVPPDET